MKNSLKLFIPIFLIVVFILLSSFCFATSTNENLVTTSENTSMPISENESNANSEWTNNDLFLCEDTIVVDSIVDGNAFLLGKDVTITGEIAGDLFVMADNVTISGGYVYSNLFVFANNVTINGIVYDIYGLCANFKLADNGIVYRDLKVLCDKLDINGLVRRNAYVDAETITFKEGASTLINGNLEYTSKNKIEIPENIVAGETTYNKQIETIKETPSVFSIILNKIIDLIKTLVFTFVIVMLMIWIAPKFLNKISDIDTTKSFIYLGIGFGTTIGIIMLAFILIFSLVFSFTILTPVIFAIGALYALFVTISFAITSIFFGKLFAKLLKLEGNVKFVLATLVSSLVLWIICLIPFIGRLVNFLITMFGIGTILVNIFYTKKQEKVTE